MHVIIAENQKDMIIVSFPQNMNPVILLKCVFTSSSDLFPVKVVMKIKLSDGC